MKSKNFKIWLCFAIIFIYGSLLLMVGYTQSGLSCLLFGNGQSYIVYLLLAQSFGLIISTILLGKLLKIVNIRYIFTGGLLIASLMLFLISFLNDFNLSKTTLIILFLIFSFILGIGIGPISPLISTYLSAIYSGNKRTTMLSVSNGVYGIGAGIIPLALSGVILKLSGQGFESTKFFYYIASSFALLAAFAGYFLDYKHSEQMTSSKILDSSKHFSILKPLIFAIFIMSTYMIAETIANYMFVNVANGSGSSKSILILATRGFGLFVMVQGLWRTFSGLFVTPYVKKRYFIIVSATVMLIGFVWILLGGLRHTYGVYLIAILFGFGIGNLWPAIYSYSIDIDERRSSFIGVVMNITSMAWIPLTQFIVALIWTQHEPDVISGVLYYSPIILAVVASSLVIVLTLASIPLHAKLKNKYQDLIKRSN